MLYTMEAQGLNVRYTCKWQEFQLSASCAFYSEYIPLALKIYFEGLEEIASNCPNGILLGCTEITLRGIRTAAEAHIRGSIYHSGTLASGL